MKASLVVLLFATTALAQKNATPAASAPGCGAADIKFAIKTDKAQHPAARPEKDKAMIYFIEMTAASSRAPFRPPG